MLESIHLLTLKCGPPLDKEPSKEEIKQAERMASILKDFEARLLEVDVDEQLEVVEEEVEDWDPQDELMDVERQASRGHMITFSGGTLVSEERERLQLDVGRVLIIMEEDTPRFQAWAGRDRLAMSHLTGMNRPGISDDDYNRYLSELGSQLFKRSMMYRPSANSED